MPCDEGPAREIQPRTLARLIVRNGQRTLRRQLPARTAQGRTGWRRIPRRGTHAEAELSRDDAADEPDRGRTGRLTAWRASAQQWLRQHQEKLEQHRQVGFLLQSSRRFKQIEGKHLALVISLNLFVAVIPLLILGRQGLSRVPAQPDLVIARVVRAIRCGPF